MSQLFIAVLNMTLTASYVALAVIVVRLLLLKAPKIFSYALWSVVLFRLVIPISFESPLSLLPNRTQGIPQDIIHSQAPAINTGMGIVDRAVNHSIQISLPPANPTSSVNPMGVALELGAVIWILGITGLLGYAIYSYFRLKGQLSTATLIKDNIYETDRIQNPFVLGLIKPKIFIPVGLAESELNYILLHEQIHIKRKDYLIKPIAFLAVTLHWFNPLIWYCYYLMEKDMEMSCDESVMKQTKGDIRASYSNSLLSLSMKQSGFLNPLAFGESNVKSRIKNVLNYKKPRFWIIAVAVIVVVAVSIGLLANPEVRAENYTKSEQLFKYKTEYVGNASKVGQIINALDFPKEVVYDYFELGTENIPYSVTIHFKTDFLVESEELFKKNAIIMFTLIGNVDLINFNISEGSSKKLLQYTRDWANNEMGREVDQFAKEEAEFTQLLKQLDYFEDVNNSNLNIL